MTTKIIVAANLTENTLDPLRKLEREGRVKLAMADKDGHPLDDVSDAEAIFRWRWSWNGPQIDRLLEAAPRVRWIHASMAGIEPLLTPLVMQRDITITNGAGTYDEPIAEWVMLAMLSIAKQLPDFIAAKQEHIWRDWSRLMLGELTNKTLLILGAGNIGSEIARRAAAFNMHVWGSRRSRKPVEHIERMFGEDDWRQALPQADFVIIALPSTPQTRGIFGAEELAAMKPGAWIINIARGTIIDEQALIQALQNGKIGGAWLDTTSVEPLPGDSPLWSLPNVMITPHITWWTEYTNQRVTDLFLENLRCFQNGEPLLNVVDKKAGY